MIRPVNTTSLPPVVGDALATALGQTGRDDPVLPRTGGPAGNARLTAWTGLILLALALAELVTLIDVQGLISWHVVIGTLLIPPALLKTGSTGWRIVNYYRRDPDYVRAGPPPLLLRVLGPGVVVSTLGLLGSGLALILVGPDSARTPWFSVLGQSVDWLRLHQGMFLIWGVLTGLHVLGRFVPALLITFPPARFAPKVAGGRQRLVALALTAVVAIVSAGLVLSATGSWHDDRHRHGQDDGFSRFDPATGH